MYKVLYRKWRPQTFTDVVGQPHITETLANEVRENRLAHAYLFTGSRGTGKTSCAKILAKAINCLSPVNGNPCNECEICRGIDSGSVMDVVEIDAASNRGIEDIRALRDESAFSPAQATYRVYIIDEVHMLTIEAFNALLKTLEEPPEHVKFILATTEVQKLPSTILSRCQRFDFRRISSEDIADRLIYVCTNENAEITRDAAVLIARISDGGMRDALSLLDRCLSVTDNVTASTVTDAAGIMSKEYLMRMAQAFLNHDTSSALALIDELHKSSCDAERLCSELMNYFRNILIIKTSVSPENIIIATDEEMSELKSLADSFASAEVFRILNILTDAANAVKKTQNRRIEAEMAVIRICDPTSGVDTDSLVERISALENELKALKSGAAAYAHSPVAVKSPAYDKPAQIRQSKPETKSYPERKNEFHNTDSTPQKPLTETPPVPDEAPLPFDAPPDEAPPFDEPLPFGDDANASTDILSALPFDDDSADYEEEGMPFGGDNEDNSLLPFGDDTAEEENLPFGDDGSGEDALPFTEQNNAPSAPDSSKFDMKTWTNIIIETERTCKPLIGLLLNTTAVFNGSVILIRDYNAMLAHLLTDKIFTDAVEKAAKTVTGIDFSVRLADNR